MTSGFHLSASETRTVILLRARWSPHGLQSPGSFFGTICRCDAYGRFDSRMNPKPCIPWKDDLAIDSFSEQIFLGVQKVG